LGRANLAKRLADGIANSGDESSHVIGVNGSWGSGKTTILRFVEEYLKREHEDEVVLLDFDPWLVSGEEELLVA
jgi:predicted KAP-like P-loop ATPase